MKADTKIYNDKKLKQLRRGLRQNQASVEAIIWSKLRNRQLNNLKFFRQYSVGNYILDFYCPKVRLAIEVDGGQHNEEKHQAKDKDRTNYLKQNSIKVIRFWNNEIRDNLDGVLERIMEELR